MAIAISIMVMGVVWVYSSINDMIRISNNATSRLEAGFLATEGMEFIKNKRDDNYVYYLNNKSSGCLEGFRNDLQLPCNWLFGIRQNLSGADYYNIDYLKANTGGSTALEKLSSMPNECSVDNFKKDEIGSLKSCLEELYSDTGYKFLGKKSDSNLLIVDDNSEGFVKSNYKRLVIVSPVTESEVVLVDPLDATKGFKSKYGSASMCQSGVTVLGAGVFGEQTKSQIAKDSIRVDSIVFWQSSKGIEFIHLATYMFNYHPYQ